MAFVLGISGSSGPGAQGGAGETRQGCPSSPSIDSGLGILERVASWHAEMRRQEMERGQRFRGRRELGRPERLSRGGQQDTREAAARDSRPQRKSQCAPKALEEIPATADPRLTPASPHVDFGIIREGYAKGLSELFSDGLSLGGSAQKGGRDLGHAGRAGVVPTVQPTAALRGHEKCAVAGKISKWKNPPRMCVLLDMPFPRQFLREAWTCQACRVTLPASEEDVAELFPGAFRVGQRTYATLQFCWRGGHDYYNSCNTGTLYQKLVVRVYDFLLMAKAVGGLGGMPLDLQVLTALPSSWHYEKLVLSFLRHFIPMMAKRKRRAVQRYDPGGVRLDFNYKAPARVRVKHMARTGSGCWRLTRKRIASAASGALGPKGFLLDWIRLWRSESRPEIEAMGEALLRCIQESCGDMPGKGDLMWLALDSYRSHGPLWRELLAKVGMEGGRVCGDPRHRTMKFRDLCRHQSPDFHEAHGVHGDMMGRFGAPRLPEVLAEFALGCRDQRKLSDDAMEILRRAVRAPTEAWLTWKELRGFEGAVDEVRSFLSLPCVASHVAWLEVEQAYPPQGVLRRLASRLTPCVLHPTSEPWGWDPQSSTEFLKEVGRLRSWYLPPHGPVRVHRRPRNRDFKEETYVEPVRPLTLLTETALAELRLLEDPKTYEGLANWSLAAEECRAAGLEVASGTVGVEAMWGTFMETLYPGPQVFVSPDTFELRSQIHFLRYNARHARDHRDQGVASMARRSDLTDDFLEAAERCLAEGLTLEGRFGALVESWSRRSERFVPSAEAEADD